MLITPPSTADSAAAPFVSGPAQTHATTAMAPVAIACHLSTARIGLVDSGASIPFTNDRGAKDALRQRSKPVDFTRFGAMVATYCCGAAAHARSACPVFRPLRRVQRRTSP